MSKYHHQQQSADDVTASLGRSRDQDDSCAAKRASNTTPLSLRLSTELMTSTRLPMTSSEVVSTSPRLSTIGPLSALDAHRRRRTAFTSDQLLELEKEFHSKKYLSLTERSQLAHDLQLSEVRYTTLLCLSALFPGKYQIKVTQDAESGRKNVVYHNSGKPKNYH